MFGVTEPVTSFGTIIKQSSPFLIRLKCVNHLWFNEKHNLIIRPFICSGKPQTLCRILHEGM